MSSGLEVDAYGGAYHRRTATDVDLPALNCDQVRRLWPPQKVAISKGVHTQTCVLPPTFAACVPV